MSKLFEIIEIPLTGEWGGDDETGEGIPVLRTTNFTNNGVIDYSSVVTRAIDIKKVKEKFLKSGDIIIEKSGGSPAQPVGRVVFFEGEDNKFLFNNFTSVLRLKDKHVNFSKYLFYHLFYFYQRGGTKRFQNKTTGISNLKLDRFIKETEIVLPPLDIQKKIAETLDTVAELLAMRKQQLVELDNLIKSTFYDMFGDPVSNEKRWKLKKLPSLVAKSKNSLKRGPFGGALKKEIFKSEGYLVYEQNHALNNDYSFKRYFIDEETFIGLKDFEVRAGDILISCSGVYLGKLSIVPNDAMQGIINQALLKVTLDNQEMNPIFFVYVFSNPTFKNKNITSNRGSGVPNLPPMPVMKNIDFITPPLTLQNEFATIVTKIEEQKALVKKAIDETQYLFDSLMSEYFDCRSNC